MTRPLYTEADLHKQGPAVRLRDIVAITGLSRNTVMAEMERGKLVGFRLSTHRGCPWLFERHEVLAWWDAARFNVAC